jgi:hypothetical protein
MAAHGTFKAALRVWISSNGANFVISINPHRSRAPRLFSRAARNVFHAEPDKPGAATSSAMEEPTTALQ